VTAVALAILWTAGSASALDRLLLLGGIPLTPDKETAELCKAANASKDIQNMLKQQDALMKRQDRVDADMAALRKRNARADDVAGAVQIMREQLAGQKAALRVGAFTAPQRKKLETATQTNERALALLEREKLKWDQDEEKRNKERWALLIKQNRSERAIKCLQNRVDDLLKPASSQPTNPIADTPTCEILQGPAQQGGPKQTFRCLVRPNTTFVLNFLSLMGIPANVAVPADPGKLEVPAKYGSSKYEKWVVTYVPRRDFKGTDRLEISEPTMSAKDGKSVVTGRSRIAIEIKVE
jgi:hypothetical protein